MADIKTAFQGEMGAYSHIACEKLFPGSLIKACSTFEETFKTAHEDEKCKIVIPIENSLAGRVADIHYLLPKYKLQIYAEHFQPVEHNLLVKEEATLKDIKFIRSHAQAIDQCQKIIQKHKFQTIISADTAGSAKELSKGRISQSELSPQCSLQNIQIKSAYENIEDESNNVTRFLIMGKNIHQPTYEKKKKYITSCIFRLKSIPAALTNVLEDLPLIR